MKSVRTPDFMVFTLNENLKTQEPTVKKREQKGPKQNDLCFENSELFEL